MNYPLKKKRYGRATHRLSSPPSMVKLFFPTDVKVGIKARVMHGVTHNSMRLGIKPLKQRKNKINMFKANGLRGNRNNIIMYSGAPKF